MLRYLLAGVTTFFIFLNAWGGVKGIRGADGTGAADGFFVRIEPSFDFYMRQPKDWPLLDTNEPQLGCTEQIRCKSWKISNESLSGVGADKKSLLSVTFFNGFPANGQEELRQHIHKLHPDIEIWKPTQNSGFQVGYETAEVIQPDGSTRGYVYYLVERQVVVRLEWTIRNFENGPLFVKKMVNSVNRASSPPKILSIATEKKIYQVGDNACYLIDMSDLKEGLTDASLQRFVLTGLSRLGKNPTVQWVVSEDDKLQRFKVCTEVTYAFGANDLQFDRRKNGIFSIENTRGQLLDCEIENEKIRCDNYASVQEFSIPDVRVENPSPDIVGPRLYEIEATSAKSIRLRTQDVSQLLYAEIYFDAMTSTGLQKSLGQFGAGNAAEFDLTKLWSLRSWRTVTAISVLDYLGNRALYVQGPDDTYWEIDSEGKAMQSTGIRVLNLLVDGVSRK